MDIVTLALARRMAKSAAQQSGGGTPQFDTKDEAVQWASDNGMAGSLVTVKTDDGYIPYIVEDDYTLTPIQGDTVDMVNLVLAALPTWTGGSY